MTKEEIYEKTKNLTGYKKAKSTSIYNLILELNSIDIIDEFTVNNNKYTGNLSNGINFEISIKKESLLYNLNLKLS